MLYLEEKYLMLLSARLERFQKKDRTLYNFRCPICGDSDKNEHKARGYIFEHKGKLFYKCHNCHASTSFVSFLKQQDPILHKEFIFEKFGEKRTNKIKFTKPIFNAEKKKEAKEIDVPDFFIPLHELSITHVANKFIQSRKIPKDSELYFIENTKLLESLNPSYEGRLFDDKGRVIIPYRNRTNRIIGYTARALYKSSLRYVNIKISDDPMIWGLNKVNKSKRIFVTEGAFDAMFIDNAVAASGSDFQKLDKVLDIDNISFIFDNEPRNKEIVHKIGQAIDSGHTIFIPPKSLQGKDINEMVLNGHSIEEIINIINKNSLSGLEAKIKFTQWKKI